MKTWISAAVVTTLLLGTAAQANPAEIAAPKGAKLLLAASADGVQIYSCEAHDQLYSWSFKSPEAALFDADGREIIKHGAGPSWTAEDGTSVVGELIAKSDAPRAGAIPWLLLKAKSAQEPGALGKSAYIRRIDTLGGAAPGAGCDARHVGALARMRYSAVYEFYSAGE